jgi:hypothetical protein
MRSGVGGTTIGSVQGVSIQAGIDVNITALGINTITGANTNIVGALITNTGNVVVTGTLTANGVTSLIGTTSVGGNFNVAGIATFNGATIMNGDLNVNAITTLTGASFINGACAITGAMTASGGVAISGGLGVTGVTTFNGSITQSVGGIATSNITDYANTGLTINPTGNMALVNLSSINGVAYIPGTNTPWYSITALTDVDMGTKNINDCSALTSPLVAGSNLAITSPIGAVDITGSQAVNIFGSGGVNIATGSGSIATDITSPLNVGGNLAILGSTITGVSTINGVAYGGSASGWANFPALNNVNLAGSNINNVKTINVEPGQNFSLVNALTATNIQGGSQLNLNAVANGANVVVSAGTGGSVRVQSPLVLTASTIVGVSSINGAVYPPAGGTPWYNVPAGGNVDMVNFNLANVGNITSPFGDTSFIVGGGLSNAFIKFNDGGGGDLAFPNITLQTTNQSPFIGDDLIRFSTSTAWFDGEVNIQKLLAINGGADFGDITINTSSITISNGSGGIVFPDGSKQNTAGGQQVASYLMTSGDYNPGSLINFTSTLGGYAPIYRTTATPLFQLGNTGGGAYYNTFSPYITGLYNIAFDTGAGSGVLTNDAFQTDDNYAVQFAITNQPTGYMVGFTKYQVLAGQDGVTTFAPTMGNSTGLFVAGTQYSIIVSNTGTTAGKNAFARVQTPIFTITYLGLNVV